MNDLSFVSLKFLTRWIMSDNFLILSACYIGLVSSVVDNLSLVVELSPSFDGTVNQLDLTRDIETIAGLSSRVPSEASGIAILTICVTLLQDVFTSLNGDEFTIRCHFCLAIIV
jgi:hypothetical protein